MEYLKRVKTPPDKRVPLTPIQCRGFDNSISKSKLGGSKKSYSLFDDEEYANLGIPLVDDVSDCDVLFGIKEVVKNQNY